MPAFAEHKFGPKVEGHPSIGDLCPFCDVAFKAGDITTLVGLFPANTDEAESMFKGESFNMEGVEVHYGCAEEHGLTKEKEDDEIAAE
jgi:hypothetical protein